MTIDDPKEIRLGPGKIMPLYDNNGNRLIGGCRIIFDPRK